MIIEPTFTVLSKRFLTLYLLAWAPYFLLYAFSIEYNSIMKGEYNILSALRDASYSLSPAMVLLLLVMPLVSWAERRQLSSTQLIMLYAISSLIFVLTWHLCIFLIYYVGFGIEQALSAAKNWFIWQSIQGIVIFAAVAGGFTAIRAVARAKHQALAIAEAQTLATQAELATLRNKLNPHFLFNTLHSIIALTRKNSNAAEEALLKFSDLLRYILMTESSNNDKVALSEELSFIRDYLDLEAIRLGNRLTVEWEIDPEVFHESVPALSIQPLVENSIKHAFNPHSRPGNLWIKAHKTEQGALLVSVIDDGPANLNNEPSLSNQQSEPNKLGGLGLKTVERRLRLLYGDALFFQANPTPNQGFSVTIIFPDLENK